MFPSHDSDILQQAVEDPALRYDVIYFDSAKYKFKDNLHTCILLWNLLKRGGMLININSDQSTIDNFISAVNPVVLSDKEQKIFKKL